jgi:Kdo2-lipid IVA lauroyltransferase/acyltransferase
MPRSLTTQCVDWIAYVAVRVAICVVQSLPRSSCERFARGASNFLANRVKIRRQVVRENLQQAFPEWTPEQAREAARGMWEHLLLMVIEIAHSERVIRKTTWRRHLRIHGMERFLRELWADRPKVILSGHYGNFEMSAFVFGLFGFRIYSVARELDNPLLDRFVTKFREARGQIILPKKGSAPDVAVVLENNGVIGLLGDQRPGPRVAGSSSSAARRACTRRSACSPSPPRRRCSSARRRGDATCSTTTSGWRGWQTRRREALSRPT